MTMNTPNHKGIDVGNCKFANAIRQGGCGSDPRIVPEFIRDCTLNSREQSREQQWLAQVDIVEVLFEIVSDPLRAECWRNWCLQCSCMPLHTLRRLSHTGRECDKAKQLEAEVGTLKAYYLPSPKHV